MDCIIAISYMYSFPRSLFEGDVSSGGSVRPFLTEDQCWEFFAENMAAFTSPTMASLPREPREDTLQIENAKVLIEDFLHLLGTVLQSVPTYQVLND